MLGLLQAEVCFCLGFDALANLDPMLLPMKLVHDLLPSFFSASLEFLQPHMMTHNMQRQLQCRFWNWKAAAAICQEKGYSVPHLCGAVRGATDSFFSQFGECSGLKDVDRRFFLAIIGSRNVGPGLEVGRPMLKCCTACNLDCLRADSVAQTSRIIK